MTIWKYPLAIETHQCILMPNGAQMLTVQIQGDQPCIWVLVEPDNPYRLRDVYMYGTGHTIPVSKIAEHAYVGTFQLDSGRLVFHVFG